MEPALNSSNTKILLVRTSAFGDIIQVFYAAKDIQSQFSNARISMCVDSRFKDLAQNSNLFDEVIAFPSREWRRAWYRLRTYKEIYLFIVRLRRKRFDIAIDFQAMYKSAVIAFLSGAKIKAGRSSHVAEGFSAFLYTKRFYVPRSQGLASQPRRLAAASLNYPLPRRFPGHTDSSPCRLSRQLLFVDGASHAGKRWPTVSWIELCNSLFAYKRDLTIVLAWGTSEERGISREIEQSTVNSRCLDSILSIAELRNLMHESATVVGNDSGPAHLAVFFGLPVVMIFGMTNPKNYTDPDVRNLIAVGSESGWPIANNVFESVKLYLSGASL